MPTSNILVKQLYAQLHTQSTRTYIVYEGNPFAVWYNFRELQTPNECLCIGFYLLSFIRIIKNSVRKDISFNVINSSQLVF